MQLNDACIVCLQESCDSGSPSAPRDEDEENKGNNAVEDEEVTVCEACYPNFDEQHQKYSEVLDKVHAIFAAAAHKLNSVAPGEGDVLVTQAQEEFDFVGTWDFFRPFYRSTRTKMTAEINSLQGKVKKLQEELFLEKTRSGDLKKARDKFEALAGGAEKSRQELFKALKAKAVVEQKLKEAQKEAKKGNQDRVCTDCIESGNTNDVLQQKVKQLEKECKDKDKQLAGPKRNANTTAAPCKECVDNRKKVEEQSAKISALKTKVKKSEEDCSKQKNSFVTLVSSANPFMTLLARHQTGTFLINHLWRKHMNCYCTSLIF